MKGEGLVKVDGLPVVEGRVERGLILRQAVGSGIKGDTKFELSSTAGVSGFALIVEVEVPGHDRVYVVYNVAPVIEAVVDAVEKALG